MQKIYQDTLHLYNVYSSRISHEISQHGPVIMTYSHTKAFRSVKRATLMLVETFVDSSVTESRRENNERGGNVAINGNSQNVDLIRQQVVQFIIPPLLEPVLQDYK